MAGNHETPSLFQALPETVHREHEHEHNNHNQRGHGHSRLHRHVHRQQLAQAPGPDAPSIDTQITEIIHTVSVIQQVAVDSNGVTLGVTIYTASSEASIDASIDASTTPDVVELPIITTEVQVTAHTPASTLTPSFNIAIPLLPSSSPIPTALPSALPSLPLPLPLPSFASLHGVNGTVLSSSNSSIAAASTFLHPTNRTAIPFLASQSSSTLTSTSYISELTASISSTSASAFTTTSTHDASSTIASSLLPSSTGGAGVLFSGSGSDGGADSENSAGANGGSGSDSNSGSPPPTTPVLVGSVFGGLAGIALLGVLILFALRWKKQKQAGVSLGSGRDLKTSEGSPGNAPGPGPAPMSQIASAFVMPAGLVGLTGYKRKSQAPSHTNSSTAGSERGFYRVSGRKLPSVLTSGGDGYGEPLPDEPLSGSSFYRDSRGFYGGTGMPLSPTSPLSDGGLPIMRSGPARTPVTTHSPVFETSPTTPWQPPDGLGRSHRDGSRNSRFTEEV